MLVKGRGVNGWYATVVVGKVLKLLASITFAFTEALPFSEQTTKISHAAEPSGSAEKVAESTGTHLHKLLHDLSHLDELLHELVHVLDLRS